GRGRRALHRPRGLTQRRCHRLPALARGPGPSHLPSPFPSPTYSSVRRQLSLTTTRCQSSRTLWCLTGELGRQTHNTLTHSKKHPVLVFLIFFSASDSCGPYGEMHSCVWQDKLAQFG
ncbi:Serine-type carboxypeptidase acuI, partial [Frankliniella fusca]